ncbi:MAG TPA: carboxypeptidase-like regulatory domain-containing protein, partial [Caulobacterales bacterium]|nr:carboxypeptidase-like regulatory domain-containing protein [Caulobacterales bacterium]
MKQIAVWAAAAAAMIGAALLASSLAHAAGKDAVALSGTVSSAKEGLMEGVLVSAKADGSTITVTVVSDDKGRYAFPAAKLAPAHY